MSAIKNINPIRIFSCSDGNIAFVVPFSCASLKEKDNLCIQYFKSINEYYKRRKDELTINDVAYLYDEYKVRLVDTLKSHNIELFGGACAKHPGGEGSKCNICKEPYHGRNLCQALSLCRKFHEDSFQDTPRLEVFLGRYPMEYVSKEKEREGGEHYFRFTIDALLLLKGKQEDKGDERGYVVLNISIPSIITNFPVFDTANDLDRIIFLKHLFYKKNLNCKVSRINSEESSLQDWFTAYIQSLFKILRLDYDTAINKYVKSAAFRYSIIELKNVRTRNQLSHQVSVSNIEVFKQHYINQIYGLLVSDEGWRNISSKELERRLVNNHWSTRSHTCSFFYEHSALIISQYSSANNHDNTHRQENLEWFADYSNEDYSKIFSLDPCLPGIMTLSFDAFLGAIEKESTLETVEETLSDTNVESNVQSIDRLLQTHSMSLDEIQTLEDCICRQFGIREKIDSIRQRYTRDATSVQNNKLYLLTQVTVSLSLASVVIATSAVLLTIFGHHDSGIYGIGLSDAVANGIVLLISVIVAALIVILLIRFVANQKVWNRMQKMLTK